MYRYFIGMIFWSPDIIKKTVVSESDFPNSDERTIFSAMLNMDKIGSVINEMEVSKRSGIDLRKVIEYKDNNIIASQWKYYERLIIEKSRQKQIKTVAEKIAKSEIPADDMIIMFNDATTKARGRAVFEAKPLKHFVDESIKALQERAERNCIPGITTGLSGLDDVFGGFQKRRLYYVGARPSQGKSALLMNFAMNGNVPCAIISLESGGRELSDRIIIRHGKINTKAFQSGVFKTGELNNVIESASEIYEKTGVIIYDEPNASINRLTTLAYDLKVNSKIEALYIDYLQIIDPIDPKKQRYEQVAEISKRLKQMARELDLPVIVAAQLRRDAEGNKPQLSDFSDSTQIERDADVAIMIYNKQEKGKMLNIGEETYLCIEKNRDGQLKDIPVDFLPQYMLFQNKTDNYTKQLIPDNDRIHF